MKTVNIALRYCGGCNPRYDRTGLVRRLQALFPDVRFSPFSPDIPYSGVLVVCGCTARCASRSDLPEHLPQCMISSQTDFDLAAAFIKQCQEDS